MQRPRGAAASMPNHGSDAVLHEQHRGRIGAEAEIERVAERDLAAIAAEDVPALRERRIHQRQDQHVLHVDIRDEKRQQGRDSRKITAATIAGRGGRRFAGENGA